MLSAHHSGDRAGIAHRALVGIHGISFLRLSSGTTAGVVGGSTEDPAALGLSAHEVPVAEVDCFDVWLRDDLAEEHPALVEWLIAELPDRDGVVSVHRYGPSALVVDVPTWDELRLRMWLTLWLQRHLPR